MRKIRILPSILSADFADLGGEFAVLLAMLVFIGAVAIARWRATLD